MLWHRIIRKAVPSLVNISPRTNSTITRPHTHPLKQQPVDTAAAEVTDKGEEGGEEEGGVIRVALTLPSSKGSSKELVGGGASASSAEWPQPVSWRPSGDEQFAPEAVVPHPSFESQTELTYDWIVGPVTPDLSSTSILGRQQ